MSGTALALVEGGAGVAVGRPRAGLLRPVAPVQEVLEVQEEVRAMVAGALQEGRDYGVIPGTEKKDKKGNDISKRVLLKPGAERLNAAFALVPSFVVAEKEVDHDRRTVHVKREKIWRNQFKGDKSFEWGAAIETEAFGLYRYVVECVLTHRDSGTVVAKALGSCSTLESKYADRPRDLENTVIKMASKRALVAATLLALGLSDQFTQDIDEAGDAPAASAPAVAVVVEEAEVVEEPLTQELACAMTLPGSPTAWGGHGGQPLASLKPKLLASVVKWVKGDPDRAVKYERLGAAAQMVLDAKGGDTPEPKAAKTEGEQGENPTANTGSSSDGSIATRAPTTTTETSTRPQAAAASSASTDTTTTKSAGTATAEPTPIEQEIEIAAVVDGTYRDPKDGLPF
jgi:hypothetical protein